MNYAAALGWVTIGQLEFCTCKHWNCHSKGILMAHFGPPSVNFSLLRDTRSTNCSGQRLSYLVDEREIEKKNGILHNVQGFSSDIIIEDFNRSLQIRQKMALKSVASKRKE